MSVRIRTIADGVQRRLKGLVDREKAMQGFLNRDVVEAYKNIQKRRWVTENASEGGESGRWALLKDQRYKAWKAKEYGADPVTGRPLLVASGRLYKSMIGESEFKKVATNKTLTISTRVPYAKGVDELRSFTTYSRETILGLRKMIRDFMFHSRIGVYKK